MARTGRGSRRFSRGPAAVAAGAAGWAPTGCSSSDRCTAARRPISPTRAADSRAIRSSRGSRRWSRAGARPCTGATGRRGSARAFFARGYWRRLAERPGAIALAWALLLLPAAAGAVWGLADPGAAVGLVPSEFAGAADPPAAGRDFGTGEGSVFATQVLVNNIQVTLLAFVGGLAFGLGTVAALVFNGLLLGVIGGLAFGADNGEAFIRLISSHGPLELSCIVVGGVAGLRLGASLIAPGPRTRLRSLQLEARRAVELAIGTAPWLVICGFAEGLLTGPELPVGVQVAIGLGLAAVFWGLVVWRGRD